jgi:hypothetical protein
MEWLVPTTHVMRGSLEIKNYACYRFRNIGYREPFTAGAVSLDYNLEATAGLKHYFNWANKQKEASGETLAEREIQLAGRPVPGAPRTGPEINFI